jgi:hypothetical protein
MEVPVPALSQYVGRLTTNSPARPVDRSSTTYLDTAVTITLDYVVAVACHAEIEIGIVPATVARAASVVDIATGEDVATNVQHLAAIPVTEVATTLSAKQTSDNPLSTYITVTTYGNIVSRLYVVGHVECRAANILDRSSANQE